MINLRSNNFHTNQFGFKRNTDKKNEPPSTNTQNRTSSKLMTGAIATTAFIAGLGANKIIIPGEAYAADKVEISTNKHNPTTNDSEAKDAKTIEWSEAQQAQRSQQNQNRPAKSGILRYYTKTETQTPAALRMYTPFPSFSGPSKAPFPAPIHAGR